MRAIVVDGTSATVTSRPLPKLRPTYMLVKVNAIALNPTDWKHVHRKLAAPGGSMSGCDYAGTVVEVGDAVNKSYNPGDRVCGCAHGCNQSQPDDGVFAEYAVVKADVQMKIPDSLSFEQAATFPLGVATVAQGLFQKALKLKLPGSSPDGRGQWVLIYGGSSATGSLGVQYAKASGYKVVTTCSPRNFDFVKGIGADEVLDYNDSECGKKINDITSNKLQFCWDTISLESSAKICSEALSTDSSLQLKYGTILPVKLPQSDSRKVETTTTFMYTIFNDKFSKGGRETPAVQEDFDFAKKFMEITEKLLKEGRLKTHPEKVGSQGLAGALQGMKDMQNDKVSGQKLVYRVEETQGEGASEDFA